MVPIDSARLVSYSNFIYAIIVSVTVFAIFDVKFWLLWSRPVWGHPGSKYIGPIGSSLRVSYMTSIVSNIVSLTAFEIFDVQLLDLSFCNLHCEPEKHTKMFFDIQSTKNLTDCDKIWYILSWVNLSYRNVNVFCLTWIVSLPYLVKLIIRVLQVNSS